MKPFSTPLVDTHQHVFWHDRDDTGLVRDLDEHGIDYAWLLTWEVVAGEAGADQMRALNPVHRYPDGNHPGIPLQDLLRTRDRFPDRFVVGYCPHPLLGNAPDLLSAAVDMHDVKVCGEWKFRIPIDDPRSLNLLRRAGELSLPVVLHLDIPFLRDADGKEQYETRWYGGTVENLQRALLACPDTLFIGHAPGFWREICADAPITPSRYPDGPVKPGGRLQAMLENHTNLMVDLSAGSAIAALERDKAYSRALLTRFSDRFLFARDYYGGALAELLAELKLPADAVAAIAWQNAEKLVPRPRPK